MKRFLLLLWTIAIAAGGATSVTPTQPGDPVWGGELRFAIHAEPKTWDPLMAAEDAASAVRMLTHGSLVRLNRKTQKNEPELAESWKILENGKKIVFQLRAGVTFSDGTPLTPDDVKFTLKRAMDPALQPRSATRY